MGLEIWSKFVLIDAQALLSIMFWECVAALFIIIMLWKYATYLENRALVKGFVWQRFLCGLSYGLVILRGAIPDVLSSLLGNILLFMSFYLENMIVLSMTQLKSRRLVRFNASICVISCVLYTLLDIFNGNSSSRVALASIIIFTTFLPITVKVLFSKKNTILYRMIGLTYLAVVVSTLPRFAVAAMDLEFSVHTTNVLQILFYLCFLVKSSLGILYFLLFIKIDADKRIESLGHDYLTGLMNRRTYLELAEQLLSHSQNNSQILCVFFFDIDSFKSINDNYGHAKGDEILIAFGQALKRSLRANDLCCRYGGDEFSICTEITSLESSNTIAERLLEEIAKIDLIPGRTITSSIGMVYGIPGMNQTIEEYIEKADAAMYQAKQNGKNQIISAHISDCSG